jgi:ring-1,2-phenylacetyl-CoA epoxidase subunit PaaE
VLAGLGMDPARIHSERFTPGPAAPRPPPTPPALEAPFATATIIHEGKRRTVPVAPGEPVLEAALRAGMNLPWSCRGGMCSTCRARLIEGAAALRVNYALEGWELAAGYVLTCQALPTTSHVTIDFDHV